MRYWIGLACFAAALALVRAGLNHRNRVRVLAPTAAAPEPAPNSMNAFGEIMRPVILFALAYLALKTSVAYHVLDAGRVVSLFDLAGMLALFGAYGSWIVMKTSYRPPAPEAASLLANADMTNVVELAAHSLRPPAQEPQTDAPARRIASARTIHSSRE